MLFVVRAGSARPVFQRNSPGIREIKRRLSIQSVFPSRIYHSSAERRTFCISARNQTGRVAIALGTGGLSLAPVVF